MGGSKTYSISKLTSGGHISGSSGTSTLVLNAVESNVETKIIAASLGAIIAYTTPLTYK